MPLKPLSRPGERKSLCTKTHQIETDVEAVSTLSTYAAPASNLGLNLITVGGRRTRRRAKWGNQLLIFSEEKRKPCLEKNRIAADNCRTNKKRREEQLQIRSHELISYNKLRKETVSYMTKDVQQLRSVLRTHSESGGGPKALEICEALVGPILDDCSHQMSPCDNDVLHASRPRLVCLRHETACSSVQQRRNGF